MQEPVSSIDLGATLVELAEIEGFGDRYSRSLMPVVRVEKEDARVLCTYMRENFAVVSREWRYIRYQDGTEELYHLKQDPHEQRNLAQIAGYRAVIEDMARSIPHKTVRAEATYPVVEAALDPGDYIVFCSDGIIEGANPAGDIFGFEQTTETIRAGCVEGLSAAAACSFANLAATSS